LKRLLFFYVFLLSATCLWAQDYATHDGFVSFFGEKPFENIRADNHEVQSIIHTKTGNIEFHALIKSFHFKKEGMEKAFNEKYMESDKYPETDFTGKILNLANINFNTPGTYRIMVGGNLTIHNVTRYVSHPGMLTVTNEGLTAKSQFTVKLEDFNIKAPRLFGKKLVTEINVAVDMKYTKEDDTK
jgi:YceI-like domain